MSYIRVYPSKNNTIFQYFGSYIGNNVNYSQTPLLWSQQINTGANPIMEMQDGKGQSKLLFSFNIDDKLKNKLSNYTYKVNLKLFDAGTLFQPACLLKQLKLCYFTDDFVEGDGYSYLLPEAKTQVSNWIKRDEVNNWEDTTFTQILTYQLNNINEDLLFEVTTAINTFMTNENYSPKFSLEVLNHQSDPDNIYTKFIFSNYTRTVFKPYLEFFIEDEIEDSVYNMYGGEENKIYLINKNNKDFVGDIIAKVKDNDGNDITPTPTIYNPALGVYYISITPELPTSLKDEHMSVVWNINGIDQYKEYIRIINPNKVMETKTNELKSLFFYPATPYSHNIVRKNDIIPFDVISQIRGYGDIVCNTYEFKVVSQDGFEMIPWSKVSVYREKMFFYVDTSFFYPELEYEVILRNRQPDYVITSNLTYKFKLINDSQSKLRELNASPYFSRPSFFEK